MQSSSRSPPKGNGNGSPKKGNGNGNGNGHGNGNGNGNGNGKGNGNGNGNGKQPPRPQPGNDPSRSPKKSIAPGLAHSAESLSKDLQRFNITIPGPDNKPVATVQSHIIPYYCFMKDRENVSLLSSFDTLPKSHSSPNNISCCCLCLSVLTLHSVLIG